MGELTTLMKEMDEEEEIELDYMMHDENVFFESHDTAEM